MRRNMLVLMPILFALGACASTADQPTMADAAAGSCNADATHAFVGKTGDAANVEAARAAAGATTVRTIKAAQAVTMEYLAGRLNVYLDVNGNIERIGCG
ncbi:MAG: I78 family peptidase inhibitor [Thermomonas sp.]|uniref:I78 family peptidase inhibitor n=1 Tax=Thermomonas sp. TaxID=1971895 RepID=UPI0039E5C45F